MSLKFENMEYVIEMFWYCVPKLAFQNAETWK